MIDRARQVVVVNARLTAVLAVALVPWLLLGWPSIELSIRMVLHPTRLDPVDVMSLLPWWCLLMSLVLMYADGPSRSPRLEPSLLAAIPLYGLGVLLLWLGPTRYGFTFWQVRFDVWVLATSMLASAMLVCGVRYLLARGVWGLWLLAFPPFAIVVAQTWTAMATSIADLVGAVDAPGWARSDVDGLVAVLVGGSIVAYTPQLLPGHRFRTTMLGIALVLATALGRDYAWLLLGGDARQLLALSAIRFVLVAVLITMVVVTLRTRGPERERIEPHPISWSRRYAMVGSLTWATGLLAVVVVAAGDQFRRDLDATWDLRSAPVRFGLAGVEYAPIPTRRTLAADAAVTSGQPTEPVAGDPSRFQRRADCTGARMPFCVRVPNVDVGQQPYPWNRMQLELDGSQSCHATRVPWYLDVFYEMPVVVPFVVADPDAGIIDERTSTWVLALPARTRTASAAVRVGDRFRSHMARAFRTRQVVVDGGAVTLQLLRHHGVAFAVASFNVAIADVDGSVLYVTYVVARRAPNGTAAARIPRSGPTSQRVAYRVLDALLQRPDRALPQADFSLAIDDVLATSRSIVSALRGRDATTSSPSAACADRIEYEPMPVVERR